MQAASIKGVVTTPDGHVVALNMENRRSSPTHTECTARLSTEPPTADQIRHGSAVSLSSDEPKLLRNTEVK